MTQAEPEPYASRPSGGDGATVGRTALAAVVREYRRPAEIVEYPVSEAFEAMQGFRDIKPVIRPGLTS